MPKWTTGIFITCGLLLVPVWILLYKAHTKTFLVNNTTCARKWKLPTDGVYVWFSGLFHIKKTTHRKRILLRLLTVLWWGTHSFAMSGLSVRCKRRSLFKRMTNDKELLSHITDLMHDKWWKGFLKIIFDLRGRVNFYSWLIFSVS